MAMLAVILVQRHTGAGDPGVGLEARGVFAGAEMQFRGETATTKKKVESHGLLKTIGAQEQMAGRRRKEAHDVRGFLQTRWVWLCYGRSYESIEQIIPAAKSDDAKTGPRGGKTDGRFKDHGSIRTTELRETPACKEDAHRLSDRRQLRSRV